MFISGCVYLWLPGPSPNNLHLEVSHSARVGSPGTHVQPLPELTGVPVRDSLVPRYIGTTWGFGDAATIGYNKHPAGSPAALGAQTASVGVRQRGVPLGRIQGQQRQPERTPPLAAPMAAGHICHFLCGTRQPTLVSCTRMGLHD